MRISAKVKPGSKAPGVALQGGVLVVRVRERAVEGAANEACVRALSHALGIAPSCVRLVRGARSREKLFEIDGVSELEIHTRLGV